MSNMISKTIHSIGDSTGSLARRIGGTSADIARRAGDGVVGVAKRIGPRRGLIGLAVFGVVLGGSIVLVRYLRARAGASSEEASTDEMLGIEGTEDLGGKKTKWRRNARRHHASV